MRGWWRSRERLLAVAWLLVVIELVSPLPAFLTFGAAWVLLARPESFRSVVSVLYEDPGVD